MNGIQLCSFFLHDILTSNFILVNEKISKLSYHCSEAVSGEYHTQPV